MLHLLNVAPTNSGDYTVSVSNYIGGPLNVTLPLRVVIPPQLEFSTTSGGALSFGTVAGQRYVIEQTDALGGIWVPVSESFIADGSPVVLSNAPTAAARLFRVRVE